MKSAKLFAEYQHTFATKSGEPQLYGLAPYIIHLEAVVAILREFGFTDPEWIAAGYLHDVFEDTKATFENVENHFGPRVVMMIDAVTGLGATRKERNASIYHKIGRYPNGDAAILKVADRIANTSDPLAPTFKMYLKEREEFHEKVARFAPHAMQLQLEANYNMGA